MNFNFLNWSLGIVITNSSFLKSFSAFWTFATWLLTIYFCAALFLFQFSSVAQLCPALCKPMDCSTAGFPDHHQPPELVQTHIHRVGEAIQPSDPLSSPSLPAFTLSQHQGLFHESAVQIRWHSIGVSVSALVLPMNIQNWFLLGWTGWISLQSKGLSRVFSNTTIQKHQSFSVQPSLWSNSHIHTWLLEKP